MQVSYGSNWQDVERDLSDVGRRQLPFAMAVALNGLAVDLVELNRRRMAREFDRPTRWTLNAFHFVRATKANPVATIKRKDAVSGRHYLETQSEGGRRKQTGFERLLNSRLAYSGQVGFVVPTKHMPRNAHGNVHPGALQKVLSGLKAQGDAAQNETDKSRAKKLRAGAPRYFVPAEGGRLSPGIYMRKGKDKPVKVFAFTTKTPGYAAQFQFYPNMQKATDRLLPGYFAKALDRAIQTAR